MRCTTPGRTSWRAGASGPSRVRPSWRSTVAPAGGSTVGTPPRRLRPIRARVEGSVVVTVRQRRGTAVREVSASVMSRLRAAAGGPMDTTTFTITSADGEEVFVYRWSGDGDPDAVVQIAHGMGEHAARYARLAEALVDEGYVVYANDHRGHGRTAGPGSSRRPRRGRMERAGRRHVGADGAGQGGAPRHPGRPARPQHGLVRHPAVPARPQRRHRRRRAVGDHRGRRHRRRHRHHAAGRPLGVQRRVRARPHRATTG